MTAKNDPADNLSFEDAYRELGEIVNRLESGELSLDESVALYERGRRLAERCASLLDSAELRVNRLVGDSGEGYRTEPLT